MGATAKRQGRAVRWLARKLRQAAEKLDGETYIPDRWHRVNVAATNRYVGVAERYIVALEDALGVERTAAIRGKHPGRFDTRRLVDAGAWNIN